MLTLCIVRKMIVYSSCTHVLNFVIFPEYLILHLKIPASVASMPVLMEHLIDMSSVEYVYRQYTSICNFGLDVALPSRYLRESLEYYHIYYSSMYFWRVTSHFLVGKCLIFSSSIYFSTHISPFIAISRPKRLSYPLSLIISQNVS